ncbi:hypothetical protein QCA50_008178 [Cerrena zonata]|uniref:Cytochrome P450 n=1 Tax=Cerrena zonata TaxID=2478898 RepID=A0AAW0GBV5_9APHY
MEGPVLYLYVVVSLTTVLFYRWRFVNLHDIPTVGPTLPLFSYLGTYRFIRDNKAMIQEGYQKFKGGVFKVAMLNHWLVVISGSKLIDEVRKLPEDQASLSHALDEFLQLHHSFGNGVLSEPLHIEVVRDQLTRHISTFFDDFRDEITMSFNDLIPISAEWTPVNALQTMQTIVARVSSRVFVGIPVCHNQDYLKLSVNHTLAIAKTAEIMACFPEMLKPLVSLFFDEGRRGNLEAKKYLGPLIEQRLNDMKRSGNVWSEKPDDMLQWFIDLAVSKGKGIDDIVGYMMLVNFASIHTSSTSFTHALYHLAAHPEYMHPLREEVDAAINAEGWTKTAMQRMKKVDSFIRESLRLNGVDGLSLTRKAMKDITLSNGTFLPAGTVFAAASGPTHLDAENYPDPTVFDPWRFSKLREKEGEGNRHQIVGTAVDFIPFGHGRYACPGRFFAANELKAIFAHVVMNYDVKFENAGSRPEDIWFVSSVYPDPSAKVLFRKHCD